MKVLRLAIDLGMKVLEKVARCLKGGDIMSTIMAACLKGGSIMSSFMAASLVDRSHACMQWRSAGIGGALPGNAVLPVQSDCCIPGRLASLAAGAHRCRAESRGARGATEVSGSAYKASAQLSDGDVCRNPAQVSCLGFQHHPLSVPW